MTTQQPGTNEDSEDGGPPVAAGLADERFAANLREQRERGGMSQADIAKLMKERGWKWHAQTVQRAEAGQRKVTVGEGEAIAKILGTTVDRLTWPGRAASAAALLDSFTGRAQASWEEIASATSALLWAQRQLRTTVGETERAGYHGMRRIREIAEEGRYAIGLSPEDAVKAGREDFGRLTDEGGESDLAH